MKGSKRAKIAKGINDLYSKITMRIINVKYSKDKEVTVNDMEDKVMNNPALNKMLNISESCLFTNSAMILPDRYAILNLKNKTGSESLSIKIFEKQRGLSGFRKKRLISLLNHLLSWIIFCINPFKK